MDKTMKIRFNKTPIMIIIRKRLVFILNGAASYAFFSDVGNFHSAKPNIIVFKSSPTIVIVAKKSTLKPEKIPIIAKRSILVIGKMAVPFTFMPISLLLNIFSFDKAS